MASPSGAWGSRSRNSSAISKRSLCTAGAMMWDGPSPASWMISSPRSVSTGSIPASAKCSLSPISSETMDLPLSRAVAPADRSRSSTIRLASAPVSAQWTWMPFSVQRVSSAVSSSGNRASDSSRMARPWSRRRSISSRSGKAARRFATSPSMARRMLVRTRSRPRA